MPSLDGLRAFLDASPEPAVIGAIDDETSHYGEIWRNASAGTLAIPDEVVDFCRKRRKTGNAPSTRLRVTSSWQCTILPSATRTLFVLVNSHVHEHDHAIGLPLDGHSQAKLQSQSSADVAPVAARSAFATYSQQVYRFLLTCPVPNTDATSQRAFLQLFFEKDWSETELGPMESWSQILWSTITTCLLSPVATVVIWGSFPGVLMYNMPYSVVASRKHPRILGMRYDLAWDEVFWQTEPWVKAVWNGAGRAFDDTLLHLRRGGFEDESYISWSMTPVISHSRVVGIWHPIVETTQTIISRRRLRLLNSLDIALSGASTSQTVFWQSVSACLNAEEILPDLPYFAAYAAPSHGDASPGNEEGNLSSWRKADEPIFAEMRRTGSDVSAEPASSLILVTKPIPGSNLPHELDLNEEASQKTPSTLLLWDVMRRLQRGESCVLLNEQETAILFGGAMHPVWTGDSIRCAAVCGLDNSLSNTTIRQTNPGEQHLPAIAIYALNTRRLFDGEYEGFVRLLSAQMAAALFAIKTTAQRLLHAHYLAYTKHKQHEEVKLELEKRTREFAAQEMYFTRLTTMLPVGIWIASGPDAEITFCNDSWWKLSGHPRSESPNTFWSSVLEDDLELTKDVWARAFENASAHPSTAETVIFRWKGKTGEGLERWCSSTALLEQGEDGFPRVTGVLADYSHAKYAEQMQRSRAEEALQQKAKLNSFIDHLSHELRNPLGAIGSGVELVSGRIAEMDLPGEELAACEEELGSITHCLKHIHRLVDETLEISKADGMSVRIEDFSPAQLARDTFRIFLQDLNTKDISHTLSLSPQIEEQATLVRSDPVRIRQVLINILANAIKFVAGRPRREIHVFVDLRKDRPQLAGAIDNDSTNDTTRSASTPRQPRYNADEMVYLLFDVQDTGPGLDDEQMAVLFRKWEQALTPKMERNYGGTGLGLFFCRKIVAFLDGQCGLQSVAGEGSTFSFFVACQKLAHAPTLARSLSGRGAANPMMPARSSPWRVLLVEDNQINQRLLAKQLVRAGCAVQTCDDGQHAVETLLELARTGDTYPQVASVDVEMPRMNGLDATKRIRELEKQGLLPNDPPLPIVGVSANARVEQQEAMLAAGMNTTVPKPFRLVDLLQAFTDIMKIP